MPEDVFELETPNPLGESASHLAEKCLELIKAYHKGPRTPLDKAAVIPDITATLTSGLPEQFPKAAVNDTLGFYLRILKQNDKSTEPTESRSKTADEPGIGSKQAGSPEPVTSAGK